MNKKENHSAKSEIEQAFLRLMTQKSYMDITVTDIVQEAKVARVSFYRNFASISEVLDSIADATAENMDLFTKRLGEKIHEKRKAVESADPDISEKYGWVVKLCVLDGVSRRWIMDEMKETPEEIIDYVMQIIKTL